MNLENIVTWALNVLPLAAGIGTALAWIINVVLNKDKREADVSQVQVQNSLNMYDRLLADIERYSKEAEEARKEREEDRKRWETEREEFSNRLQALEDEQRSERGNYAAAQTRIDILTRSNTQLGAELNTTKHKLDTTRRQLDDALIRISQLELENQKLKEKK